MKRLTSKFILVVLSITTFLSCSKDILSSNDPNSKTGNQKIIFDIQEGNSLVLKTASSKTIDTSSYTIQIDKHWEVTISKQASKSTNKSKLATTNGIDTLNYFPYSNRFATSRLYPGTPYRVHVYNSSTGELIDQKIYRTKFTASSDTHRDTTYMPEKNYFKIPRNIQVNYIIFALYDPNRPINDQPLPTNDAFSTYNGETLMNNNHLDTAGYRYSVIKGMDNGKYLFVGTGTIDNSNPYSTIDGTITITPDGETTRYTTALTLQNTYINSTLMIEYDQSEYELNSDDLAAYISPVTSRYDINLSYSVNARGNYMHSTNSNTKYDELFSNARMDKGTDRTTPLNFKDYEPFKSNLPSRQEYGFSDSPREDDLVRYKGSRAKLSRLTPTVGQVGTYFNILGSAHVTGFNQYYTAPNYISPTSNEVQSYNNNITGYEYFQLGKNIYKPSLNYPVITPTSYGHRVCLVEIKNIKMIKKSDGSTSTRSVVIPTNNFSYTNFGTAEYSQLILRHKP